MESFDFNKFLRRKDLKHKDAAKLLDSSLGLIGAYASNVAKPSYEKIINMIKAGMTAQELFGDECAGILIANSTQSKENSEDFKIGMKEMMEEILREKFSK